MCVHLATDLGQGLFRRRRLARGIGFTLDQREDMGGVLFDLASCLVVQIPAGEAGLVVPFASSGVLGRQPVAEEDRSGIG